MRAEEDPELGPDRLLREVASGERPVDDPEVVALASVDAVFRAELGEWIEIQAQLDRAGEIERTAERLAGESPTEERLAFEARFRARLHELPPPGAAVPAHAEAAGAPPPDPPTDPFSPAPPGAPRRSPGPLVWVLAAAAAAVLLGIGLFGPDSKPAVSPYEDIFLGEGDGELRWTPEPEADAGLLEWPPIVGGGETIVRILEATSPTQPSPRSLLVQRVGSAGELRLAPLPWSAPHDTILLRIEYRLGGQAEPELVYERRLPPSP